MKIPLTKQLEKAIINANSWEARYWVAQEKVDKFEKEQRNVFDRTLKDYEKTNRELNNMNRQMMEIIRWHVNPETAKPQPPTFDKFGNVVNP